MSLLRSLPPLWCVASYKYLTPTEPFFNPAAAHGQPPNQAIVSSRFAAGPTRPCSIQHSAAETLPNSCQVAML